MGSLNSVLDRDGVLKKAEGLAEQGRFAAARQILQVVLDATPNDAVALHQAALVNALEGRAKPAVRLMYRALRSEPENYRHYWELGRLLAADGERGWALACLAQALKMRGGALKGSRALIGAVLGYDNSEGAVSVDVPKPISCIKDYLFKLEMSIGEASDVATYCRKTGAPFRVVLQETERTIRGFVEGVRDSAHELGRVKVPAAYVAEIPGGMLTNGTYLLLGADYSVLTDRFAAPIWKGMKNSWTDANYYRTLALFSTDVRRFFPLLVGKVVDGPVPEGISLLAPTDIIWANWVAEVLPRLMLVDQFPEYDELPLLVNENLPAQAFESLDMVNSKRRKVVLIEGNSKGQRTWIPTTYRFARLVFPSPMAQLGPKTAEGGEAWDLDDHLQNPAALHWLRQQLLPARTSPRRLYLSRAKQGRRRIVNEKKVISLLRRHGFDVVYPERLSFKDQLELWANAEIVVAPAGSAMVNMIFAPRHALVVALVGDASGTNLYWPAQFATELELRLIIMEGNCDPVDRRGNSWSADFSVSLERLGEILSDAEASL